jgi:hypothetical protein
MSSPGRKDFSTNDPLTFNEWLPRFHDECSAVSKVKTALSTVPDKHLHNVHMLVWIYSGRNTFDRVRFIRGQCPPGGTKRFLRDLGQLATQISSFNDCAGHGLFFFFDCLRNATPNTEILDERIRDFRGLPQLMRNYAELVECYFNYLQNLFVDRNCSLTRILILLARYFPDSGRLARFNDIGILVSAGYAAHGNQRSQAKEALAIRNRLNRYRKSNPIDFVTWFNYKGDLPDLLATAVHEDFLLLKSH